MDLRLGVAKDPVEETTGEKRKQKTRKYPRVRARAERWRMGSVTGTAETSRTTLIRWLANRI